VVTELQLQRMDAKLNAAGWMSEKMGGLRLANLYTLVTYCKGAFVNNSLLLYPSLSY